MTKKPKPATLNIDLSRQPWWDEAARIRHLRDLGLYVLCANFGSGWGFVGAFREPSIAQVNELLLKEKGEAKGVVTLILEPKGGSDASA